MTFQPHPTSIEWHMHFASPPERVFAAVDTQNGRESFWAESAPERDGCILFTILNYPPFSGRILQRDPPHKLILEYFGTTVEFSLISDQHGGTDLALLCTNVEESLRHEMTAGWVSVLMAMKGAVDFGIDLRNHDPARSWQQGYADN